MYSIFVATLTRNTYIVDVNIVIGSSLFAEIYVCEFAFIADMHFNRVPPGNIYEIYSNAKENIRENLLLDKLLFNCNLRIYI